MPPTQFDISWESIRDLKLRIPPIEKQRKIADYLDENCGNIQKLVQLRESQIALQPTLIQDFLAHSIHPQMPSKKLKYLADIRVSNVDKHMVEGELGVEVCNYVDVYRNRRISSNIQFMKSTASREQIRRFSLRRGDIVFTKDSETAEDIAATSFIDEDIENLVLGYHCGVLRVFDIDPNYLYWAIQSPYVKNQFRVSATGVTRVGLKLDDIGLVDIPVADKLTQLEIVEDIRKVVEQSDRYSSFANSQVLALKELKESLITGAVTGQFDVTGKWSVA
jgi:type I restriction enzyme S subunit